MLLEQIRDRETEREREREVKMEKETNALVTCVCENVTCIVCTEAYRKPITMPCGHSFCRMCIGKLILTHLKACKQASDQNKMSETRSGKCPTCREALPTIAPAYRVNVALESVARAYEKHTNVDKEQYDVKEEAEDYSELLKKIASLQKELRWKNTTYEKKLAMILARDSAVPSLGEAAADDYEEIDVEEDVEDAEEYRIVKLLRENFGERELTRSLVMDPTQDHMQLALSFISFPRRVRLSSGIFTLIDICSCRTHTHSYIHRYDSINVLIWSLQYFVLRRMSLS